MGALEARPTRLRWEVCEVNQAAEDRLTDIRASLARLRHEAEVGDGLPDAGDFGETMDRCFDLIKQASAENRKRPAPDGRLGAAGERLEQIQSRLSEVLALTQAEVGDNIDERIHDGLLRCMDLAQEAKEASRKGAEESRVVLRDCLGKVVPLSETVIIDKGWIKMGLTGSDEPSGWVHDPVHGHVLLIVSTGDLAEGIGTEGAFEETGLWKMVNEAFRRVEARLRGKAARYGPTPEPVRNHQETPITA